jgi:hypothetical protein
VGALNGAHILGTLVPVEEPSTASLPDFVNPAILILFDRHVGLRAGKLEREFERLGRSERSIILNKLGLEMPINDYGKTGRRCEISTLNLACREGRKESGNRVAGEVSDVEGRDLRRILEVTSLG